ncbi:MAG: reductive dehalogenase, partial [Deltaproteobacteria bacterium]|nr:reductive dehalogenase [Deltaproteobacteria bacterium]
KVGKLLGGGLVGIAPFDERWLYTHGLQFIPGKKPPLKVVPMENALPFKPKSIIMVVVEMNYEVAKLNPGYLGNASPNQGYSRMAVVAPSLAKFIQHLGYRAIPFGNDTVRNVPMAIAAGLGEGSRMGMLVTEKFGPRVRLCGVATEMELPFDKPVTFGVTEFCKVCMKCADNCPSSAITKEREPSMDGQHNRSNSVGIKKWHVNAEKCLTYWGKLGCGCMNCIACCPYNKLDTWNHDMAKMLTVVPVARNMVRSLDESFGYGKVFDEKAMKAFWKKG